MSMQFTRTAIDSVFLIDAEPHTDSRGSFTRIFCQKDNAAHGVDMPIVQVNRSMNHFAGTVRGLHYQTEPYCETKWVSCIRGSVFDVTLDIRRGSPTFLQWIGIELSEKNMRMVHIPKGCAHGFQTLEPDTEILYFHSEFYSPENSRGIRYDDQRLKIKFPLDVTTVSRRDANFPFLRPDFSGVIL